MKKQLWKDIIAALISLLISWFIFTLVFRYARIFSYLGITGGIALEIIFAYVIFMSYKLVTDWEGRRIFLKIFLFLYTGMFIALLLSRSSPIYGINMKIGYINDYAPYVLWANLLILSPLGFMVRYLYKVRIYIAVPVALFSVTILELLQYILRRGCLDINDIILNTLGFGIGFILCSVYNGIKTKHLDSDKHA